ncbi:hypothetical protein T484DRAFT_2529318 [Baffinella frigidus]|nr:hypothetical protein T484DRAFT_2529318 [Cryptophyta sp. CCMP2293]
MGRPITRLRGGLVAALILAVACVCCLWAAGQERGELGGHNALESEGAGSEDGGTARSNPGGEGAEMGDGRAAEWSATIAEYHRARYAVVKHTENFVACVARANGVPQVYSTATFSIKQER